MEPPTLRTAGLTTALRRLSLSPSLSSLSLSLLLTLALFLLLLDLPDDADAKVFRRRLGERVKSTRYGKVRGVLVEFPNRYLRPVEAYLGLRYADLDEGGMRFMPPKNPKEQWNGVRTAVRQQPVCPQAVEHEKEYVEKVPAGRAAHLRNITPFLMRQTEDCLSLNLYVPIQEWNDTEPMAVMVYIHGESYETGTGNAYDGSVLSSFGHVIVVTINYRLGVLGFLSTEDRAAMGNYALLDVTQALLWLRDNIATFDGDPNRVTLFGHGTGAAIVNLLMLSPFVSDSSGNFFQRAIIQSGSAYSTWAVAFDPKWCRERLAIAVNCSRHLTNTDALIHCLRERSYTELVHAAPKAPKYYSCFAPSIDKWTVLPAEVDELVKERKSKFASVPVMFGITKNEAYAYLKQSEVRKGVSKARKMQIIRTYVQNVFRFHRQKIYEILDHHYTDWADAKEPVANRDSVLELLSDGQFVSPLIRMANAHAETADTYLYSFAYSTQSESKEKLQGIHGDELPYVFGAPLVDGISPFPSSYTSTEKMMSHAIMTYWTNFAKTGDPNSPINQSSTVALNNENVNNRFFNLNWPKYTKDGQEYLPISEDIDYYSRRPTTRHHYRAQKLALWQDLIPKINKDDGSDPKSHLLDHWDNVSSFDDYDNLVTNFENIFPSPPPMPPSRPVPVQNNNNNNGGGGGPGGTYNYSGVTIDYENEPGDTGNPRDNGGLSGDGRGGDGGGGGGVGGYGSEDPLDRGGDKGGGGGGKNGDGVTSPAVNAATGGDNSSGVPLSMVVAIGGSLLLINILIFAGLCYQRERIRKMRPGKNDDPPDLTFEEARYHRKCEQDSTQNSVCAGQGASGAAPECMSLMSSSSSHQHHCLPPRKNSNGPTCIHNPSPQPSLQSRRGPSQPRSTPPGEPPPPSINCGYAPVPTNVTSPIHRPSSRSGGVVGVGDSSIPSVPLNHAASIETGNYVNSKATARVGGAGGGGGGSGGGVHPGPATEIVDPHAPRPLIAPSDLILNANGGDRIVGGGGGTSAFVSPGVHGGNKAAIGGGSSKPMSGVGSGGSGIGGSGGSGSGGGGIGLSTFGPGYQGIGGGRSKDSSLIGGSAGPGVGSGPEGLQSAGSSNGGGGGKNVEGDPVYKTINKSGQPNAVTIV